MSDSQLGSQLNMTFKYASKTSCAINKGVFFFSWSQGGTGYDNYEPYDWSCDFINKWAVEAIKTLKDK